MPHSSASGGVPHADAPFPYMRFARQHLMEPHPRSLGLSGMPLHEDAPDWARDGRAQRALRERLATRYELTEDHIHLACGSSHANFACYLALAKSGRVIAERPSYEGLHRLTDAVGATLAFVQRDPKNRWRLDISALEREAQGGVDLVAVTDLHNPSGLRIPDEDYDALASIADAHRAYVLVDEVYADFDPVERPSAAARHPRFLATNSLTKVHGHPFHRCGWTLAAPHVIERIARWDDLVCPVLPPEPMIGAATYLLDARGHAANARRLARKRMRRVDAWVDATDGISWTPPHGGITGVLFIDALKARGESVSFCNALREERGVIAIPGEYFQLPGAIRISYGLEPDVLDECLQAIATTRDVFSS